MKYLKVNLWHQEIGRLVWESATRRSYFEFNRDANNIPDVSPLLSPVRYRNTSLPIYGDERPVYQGLPPFIADSLPDSWGNTLFDKWVKENKIPRNKITPLYKLMFIGSRGMGALEYEPAATEFSNDRDVNIKALYDMSLKVLEDRDSAILAPDEQLTLQSLLAVGTSAGGRQMKAIIAIDNKTGEIHSGQKDDLKDSEYYILKFGNSQMPMAEIEVAYYNMAKEAGILMEDCRLFAVEGINHFLTHRFDRKNGKKIHIQTLAAINPEVRSYEELITTCRALNLPESDIRQLYSRMVFNVLATNTDDHNRNFAFMLEEGGCWRLAPAYDMTFIFNISGTGPNLDRRLSICSKTSEITKDDLIGFAREYEIIDAEAIIDKVSNALGKFNEYAYENNIPQPWRGIIQKTISDNLVNFGYLSKTRSTDCFIDCYGRQIADFKIFVNAKGMYEITATIDGIKRRRFIRRNMAEYKELSSDDIYTLSIEKSKKLIETLMP